MVMHGVMSMKGYDFARMSHRGTYSINWHSLHVCSLFVVFFFCLFVCLFYFEDTDEFNMNVPVHYPGADVLSEIDFTTKIVIHSHT